MIKRLLGWFFTTPALLLLGVFSYVPLVVALCLSVYETDGLAYARFVGLAHFKTLLGEDGRFCHSVLIMLVLMASFLMVWIVPPLLGARLISAINSAKIRFIYRVLFTMPMVVPGVAILLIWRELYASDGALNQLLDTIGLGALATTWLGNPQTALLSIIAIGLPWIGGIGLLIFLAALDNIPDELRQAARIDGAGTIGTFYHVELPLLLPQIGIVAVLAQLAAIQGYESVLILTNGGPAESTLVPGLYMFQNAFWFGRLGYASAIGVFLLIFGVGFSLLSLRLSRGRA
jgi:ABC-type sugar transport system permease subunit